MHRRLQFDKRENPAPDRRYGSRSVLQKDLLHGASPNSFDQQTMLVASDDSEVKSATAKRLRHRRGKGSSVRSQNARKPDEGSSDTQISADVNYNTNQQLQRIVNDSEFEPLLDAAQAARLLRIHPKTLRVKAGHGIIPGIQIGRVWRFRVSTLNRWLEGITGCGRR